MIVNATELKNNLGKYLRASAREEIVITSNGRKIARLVAFEDADKRAFYESYLKEKAEAYARMPKKVYLFENNDLAKSAVYKKDEKILSYVFEGLEVSLKSIYEQ